MKKKLGIILILIFIMGCFGLTEKYEKLEVKVIKNDISNSEEFSKLLFFSNGTRLDGIDPETNEIKVQYEFNYIIGYGDVTEDGRVLLCDLGSINFESERSKFFVINYKGEVLKEINTIVNPKYLKIAGDNIFVSNEIFNGKRNNKIVVYDVNNYNEKKILDDVECSIKDILIDDKYVFFNIYGRESKREVKKILKVNVKTLEYETILGTSLIEINEISIIDSVKNEEIKRIKGEKRIDHQQNICDMMNKPKNKLIGINPIMIDVKFACFTKNIKFGRFIFLNKNTTKKLDIKKVNTKKTYENMWVKPDYIKNDKAYFKNEEKVKIYSCVEKKWIKEIVCAKY